LLERRSRAARRRGTDGRAIRRFRGEKLQIELGRGSVEGNANLLGRLLKSHHLHVERPHAIGEIGKAERAIAVRGGDYLAIASRGRDGCTGKG